MDMLEIGKAMIIIVGLIGIVGYCYHLVTSDPHRPDDDQRMG